MAPCRGGTRRPGTEPRRCPSYLAPAVRLSRGSSARRRPFLSLVGSSYGGGRVSCVSPRVVNVQSNSISLYSSIIHQYNIVKHFSKLSKKYIFSPIYGVSPCRYTPYMVIGRHNKEPRHTVLSGGEAQECDAREEIERRSMSCNSLYRGVGRRLLHHRWAH